MEEATTVAPKRPSGYQQRVESGRWPVSMEFPMSLKERLSECAEIEQRSMAAVCRIAVEQYLDHAETSAPYMEAVARLRAARAEES